MNYHDGPLWWTIYLSIYRVVPEEDPVVSEEDTVATEDGVVPEEDIVAPEEEFFPEEDIDENMSNLGLSGSYFVVRKLSCVEHRSGWILEGSVCVNGWKNWEKLRKLPD